MQRIQGLHHISSIVKQAQENIDFYTNVLGLRLIKQTLNYDDKGGYHFYFGPEEDKQAISTFFPMSDIKEGVIGDGQVGHYRYAIPKGTSTLWQEQLEHYGIFYYTYERFGEKIIAFADPHGLELELIETERGEMSTWSFNRIDKKWAIKGIHSATLFSHQPDQTRELLEQLFGYKLVNEDEEFYALELNEQLGSILYLRKKNSMRGISGSGTVHHIALKVNDNELLFWRDTLLTAGYKPTEVKDRNYFKSIYFREHGGIIFELATAGPGLLIDETAETLGETFIIPQHYKEDEAEITAQMMPIFIEKRDALRTYNYRDKEEYVIAQKREKILAQLNNYPKIAKERMLTTEEAKEQAALRVAFVKTK